MDFRELSRAIKTYTERIEEPEVLQNMKTTIHKAQCIVFLGFAYHRQNMALLKPEKRTRTTKQIYGTAYGMSYSDVGEVTDELDSFFPASKTRPVEGSESYSPGGIALPVMDMHDHIRIENKLTCTQLFDYYAKSLAG